MQNRSSDVHTLPDRPLAGSLLVLGSTLMFAGISALVKLATASLATEMVVFFRNFMALVILMPWLLVRHRESIVRTRRIRLHLLRAAAGLGAMYCIFFALGRLQLGEAVLLSFTSPLFIPLIAWFWLKESVSRQTRLAIVIGFIGIALILKPGHGVLRPAALMGLMAGVLMALAMVTIRRMSVSEPTVRIVFYFALFATAISAIPLGWSWQPVPQHIWLILIAIGLLAVFGQIMLTKGYGLAPVARIGPIGYGNVLFSTLFGWLFWNETLDPLTWVGALCIFVAGIVTSYQRDTIVASPGTVHQCRPQRGDAHPKTETLNKGSR